jgi:hypothetical protein
MAPNESPRTASDQAPDDRKLLTPEAALAEEEMARLAQPPVGFPAKEQLRRVAERILEQSSDRAGEIAFLEGSLDIFPENVSVGGHLRVAGVALVEREVGDRLFEGEMLMTGRRSALLAKLECGAEAWLASSSAAMFATTSDNPRQLLVKLMAGRAFCCANSPEVSVKVFAPGGEAETVGGSIQVSAMTRTASRLEVIEGVARASARAGHASVSARHAAAMDSGRDEAPNAAPERGTHPLSWLSVVEDSSGLPSGWRDRIEKFREQGLVDDDSSGNGRSDGSSLGGKIVSAIAGLAAIGAILYFIFG